MKLIEYPDREMLSIDLANKLAGELNNVLLHEDQVTLVVPGGSTPGPIFDDLCASDLDWDRVTVLLSDERWVPESSDRSNARLVRERLLVDHAAAARFIPFYQPDTTPQERAAALSAEIAGLLPVSVALLGMGADMHTASLFPGSEDLAAAMDQEAPPVMAVRVPGLAEERLTLSLPVLSGALACHIVITGEDKLEALKKAQHMHDAHAAPVKALLPGASVHWAR